MSMTSNASTPKRLVVRPPKRLPNPPSSNDLLGCVYQLVQNYIHDEQCPPYLDNQILRSWQSLATAPTADEYCVITHLSSVRHGSNAYQVRASADSQDAGRRATAALFEHLVQVDFLSTDNHVTASNARRRATIFEMLLNSYYGNALVQSINKEYGVLYCDAPMSIAEFDESHRLRQRHSVTAHLSQTVIHTLPIPIVDAVRFELRPVPSDAVDAPQGAGDNAKRVKQKDLKCLSH